MCENTDNKNPKFVAHDEEQLFEITIVTTALEEGHLPFENW